MKQIISLTLITTVILSGVFVFFEPQLIAAAWGPGDGPYADPITVTQTVSAEIALSSPDDVTMSGAIPGITGGSATGTATWNVITNNNAGFKMELEASADPALAGTTHGDSFADYGEASSGVPDYAWTVAESDAEFGYTVVPETAADADQSFKDDGADCNVATNNPDGTKCWLGFEGTTKEQVVNRSTETDIGGEDEVVNFKAELNGPATDADGFLVEDTYTATITATVTMN